MIPRIRTDCVCTPSDFAPTHADFEIVGAFNPGAIDHAGEVILLVRIAERPRAQRPGQIALPRWEHGALTVDWVPQADWQPLDPRVYCNRHTGLVRLSFTSHLRVVHLDAAGRRIARLGARFDPQGDFESYGVEDPRIVRLGDACWITYVAAGPHGVATALASTTDFHSFRRHGVIFPRENKDVALFPEQIDGHFVALHRPTGGTAFTQPEIWLARSPDLLHWGRHTVLVGGREPWQLNRVGAGAPPLRVADGWLEIYHGVSPPRAAGEVGLYSAAAMLLDAKQPERILARGREPLWTPQSKFERVGYVPDVVFPTGLIQRGDLLQVYYGAADTSAGCIELRLSDVLNAAVPRA